MQGGAGEKKKRGIPGSGVQGRRWPNSSGSSLKTPPSPPSGEWNFEGWKRAAQVQALGKAGREETAAKL